MGRYLRLGVFALVFLGLVVWLSTRLSVTTDMSKMMPVGEDRDRAALARAIATSRLSQTVVLTIGTSSTEQAVRASERMERALREEPSVSVGVSNIQSGPPQGIERALWELYTPRRLAFSAGNAEEARGMVSDAGLEQVVARLKEQLLSPLSALVTRTAPSDPFLALPRLFERLERGAAQSLRIVDGRYVAQEHFGVLFLELEQSSFDAEAQEGVVSGIERAFSKVRGEFPDARLEWSALARFSVNAKKSIQKDVTRVSVLSSCLVVALCLLLFRSLRMLLLTFVPLASGMLVGLLAVSLVYGEVHGLTLAFGASLIGVTIDAVVHFYVHYLYRPSGEDSRSVMRRVAPAMALGGLTTVVGFVVLSGTALVGLAQAAVFGACGILAAYGVTYLVLPELMPSQARLPQALLVLGSALRRGYEWLSVRSLVLWGVLVLSLSILVGGALSARWDQDMTHLLSFDRTLEDEDERVRARVAQFDTSRFVVAWGANDEEALARNERAADILARAVQAGEVSGYQNVAPLLPSAARQTAILDVLEAARLTERLAPILEEAGFAKEAFEPFWGHLGKREQPVVYSEIEGTAVAPLLEPHRVVLDDRVAWLTFLRDARDLSALEKRFEAEEGITFLDQGALMSGMEYRPLRLVALFGFGLFAILGLMVLRYRSPARALAALLPALAATSVTVSVVSLLGFSLNLVAVSALLMVLSMGADYGVFMVENLNDPTGRETEATLAALSVACFTTVVSFSVLALSDQQILRVIGWTAAVGVSCSFLFSGLSSALLARWTGSGLK